jgi:hypothetical protein
MPVVSEGESLLINIFNELSSGRSFGMSVGPIPISLIWEAQKRYNLSDLAVQNLQRLDSAYLRKLNDKKS